ELVDGAAVPDDGLGGDEGVAPLGAAAAEGRDVGVGEGAVGDGLAADGRVEGRGAELRVPEGLGRVGRGGRAVVVVRLVELDVGVGLGGADEDLGAEAVVDQERGDVAREDLAALAAGGLGRQGGVGLVGAAGGGVAVGVV